MDDSQHEPAAETFPTAHVVDRASARKPIGKAVSRLWWVTAICLVVAALLVWSQLSGRGPIIYINFAEGHGLTSGDTVRYRGIVVGEVRRVHLADDMEGVTVMAELTEEAESLAREGTRFWIERPDIRIGAVRGLDTVLGGHYVGVAPGPREAPLTNRFEGLEHAPEMVEGFGDDLEIVLESHHRLGLQKGSPVNYRGIQIGAVQSVGLANDSATVLARVLIQPAYRALVCENSRFWSTSGFDLKFGLQGLELNAETLATIAAGGVAMATPESAGQPVTTGHRFELVESPQSEWLKWQPRIAIGNASLPAGMAMPQPVLAQRHRPGGTFGLFGRSSVRGWLLVLEDDRLLGPAQLLKEVDEKEVTLEVAGHVMPLSADSVKTIGLVSIRQPSASFESDVSRWPVTRIEPSAQPEDVVITCGTDDKTLAVAAERIATSEDLWRVDASVPLEQSWLGACVVSATSGMLVGIVVEAEDRMVIAPIADELLTP